MHGMHVIHVLYVMHAMHAMHVMHTMRFHACPSSPLARRGDAFAFRSAFPSQTVRPGGTSHGVTGLFFRFIHPPFLHQQFQKGDPGHIPISGHPFARLNVEC